MNWLPTVRCYSWMGCDAEGEATDGNDVAGVAIVISWGRWMFDINIGRRVV